MNDKAISTKFSSFPALSGLLIVVFLLSLFVGAYQTSIPETWAAILRQGSPQANFLIWEIRLPRLLVTALAGAGLSIAGAAIQGLFRNPLADQSLIGVTSGAMLFAVLSIVGIGPLLAHLPILVQQVSVSIFAFLGGLVTTLLVYRISTRQGNTSVLTMLLAGIAISALAAAVTGIFIYLSDEQQLRDITFWSLGSFSAASWTQFWVILPILFLSMVGLMRHRKSLNALMLGEQEAAYLGIDVKKTKTQIIWLTALIAGVCIASAGIIGFVGLIIPHFLRLINGPNHNYLLVASALLGAVFLVLADTLARTLIAPAELPIGILTALVGAPFFLWLLLRNMDKTVML